MHEALNWHEIASLSFSIFSLCQRPPHFPRLLVIPYSLVLLEEPYPRIGWQSDPCRRRSSRRNRHLNRSVVRLPEGAERFPKIEYGVASGFGGIS